MKYNIKEFPNTNIQEFNVNEKVCSQSLSSLTSSEDIARADIFKRLSEGEIEDISYVTNALFAIDGIIEVGYDKYKIRITKADVFDWSEIEEQVIHVIKSMIAKGAEMIEMPRNVCTDEDRIINRQQIDNYNKNRGGFNDFNEGYDRY